MQALNSEVLAPLTDDTKLKLESKMPIVEYKMHPIRLRYR